MAEGQSRYVKLTRDRGRLQEDITPGELNQPIEVPQVFMVGDLDPQGERGEVSELHVQRCIECGQTLPERYEPPADEDWTTGICGCAEDTDSCCTGLFCPCVLFGRNIETLKEDIPWSNACVCHAIFVEGGITLAAVTALFNGLDPDTTFLIVESLLFTWWMCGIYTGLFRQSLQKKYHLKNSPCDPCMVHCCMHWCAICQEHREMRSHLSDNGVQATVTNPPPVQEMNSGDKKEPAASSSSTQSSTNTAQNNLELQAV
ncbi:cell number regulator 6 [Senna tora]|uniref:Cell number regulator 6 n=1 Tax=Senna tora TaxID=362788 RepID=A0A835CJS5_9FABA|nr:cell number regulator 6 [Senna tora]